jgi:hypothetical protein
MIIHVVEKQKLTSLLLLSAFQTEKQTFNSKSSKASGSGSGARRFFAGAWSVITGMGLPAAAVAAPNLSDNDRGAFLFIPTLATAGAC